MEETHRLESKLNRKQRWEGYGFEFEVKHESSQVRTPVPEVVMYYHTGKSALSDVTQNDGRVF